MPGEGPGGCDGRTQRRRRPQPRGLHEPARELIGSVRQVSRTHLFVSTHADERSELLLELLTKYAARRSVRVDLAAALADHDAVQQHPTVFVFRPQRAVFRAAVRAMPVLFEAEEGSVPDN